MTNLLGVLGHMKLVRNPSETTDLCNSSQGVANYEMRCLKPLLIDDTVLFQQRFFMKKMASGGVDTFKLASGSKLTRRFKPIVSARILAIGPCNVGVEGSHCDCKLSDCELGIGVWIGIWIKEEDDDKSKAG